jgi:hypothetical protein
MSRAWFARSDEHAEELVSEVIRELPSHGFGPLIRALGVTGRPEAWANDEENWAAWGGHVRDPVGTDNDLVVCADYGTYEGEPWNETGDREAAVLEIGVMLRLPPGMHLPAAQRRAWEAWSACREAAWAAEPFIYPNPRHAQGVILYSEDSLERLERGLWVGLRSQPIPSATLDSPQQLIARALPELAAQAASFERAVHIVRGAIYGVEVPTRKAIAGWAGEYAFSQTAHCDDAMVWTSSWWSPFDFASRDGARVVEVKASEGDDGELHLSAPEVLQALTRREGYSLVRVGLPPGLVSQVQEALRPANATDSNFVPAQDVAALDRLAKALRSPPLGAHHKALAPLLKRIRAEAQVHAPEQNPLAWLRPDPEIIEEFRTRRVGMQMSFRSTPRTTS